MARKRKKKLKIPRRIRGKMSAKISKMIREWKKTGKITTSRAVYRPKTLAAAQRQAARIEYERYGLATKPAKRKKIAKKRREKIIS